MSLVSIWRQVRNAWRNLSRQLWPEPPADPMELQLGKLRRRLSRLQERLLTTRRTLNWLATCQRRRERLHQQLANEIAADVQSAGAVAGALELERLRAVLARIQNRRERLEGRYQQLCERFHTTRAELAKLSR